MPERKDVLTDIRDAFQEGLTKANPASDAAKAYQGSIDWANVQIQGENGSTGTGTKALHCDLVVDRTVINTHMNWRSSVWGQPGWKNLWRDLGARNARTAMTKAAEADWLEVGAKIILVTADNANPDRADVSRSLDVAAAHPELVLALEGPNEPNHNNPPNWAANVKSYQQWLYDKVKGMPALSSKPVMGPSIWGRLDSGYAALGDMSSSMDLGNLHYYTGGNKPTLTSAGDDSSSSSTLDNAIKDALGLSGGKDIAITETNWAVVGPGLTLNPGFVTDKAQAKYIVRMLCESLIRGMIWKTAVYTLLDDVRNPPRYHGIATHDLAPRMSFGAIKRFLSLHNDPVAFEPESIVCEVTPPEGAPDIRHTPLLQKSDKRFKLNLWNDVDSYNRRTYVDIDPPPVDVVVMFDKSMNARYMEPTLGWDWIPLPSSDHFTVPVRDHVLHLEVW